MNLFECLAIVMLIVGFVIGAVTAFDGGAHAALAGAFKGAGLAYAWFVGGMFALLSALALGMLYRPPFPRCRNRLCRAHDYRHSSLGAPAGGRDAEIEQRLDGKLVRCRCGTLYIRSLRERRFYEVHAEGGLAPFMRYRPFGRWRRDEG